MTVTPQTSNSHGDFRPHLVYYNDGHHFHGKRVEPPVSVQKLRQPVDEVLGTGVDLLVLGLGYGDVYFHNSKVGRVVGEAKEVWESYIDWRIMRMVQVAREKGTDQVREVIQHGRKNGLKVFPSLRLQDAQAPGADRCGWLRWRHEAAVCHGVNDPRWPKHQTQWAYDFTNHLVWDDKKAMIREMLVDYEADGIELDFMFFPLYFRMEETEAGISAMNRFLEEVRDLVDSIGAQQGRKIPIMARVHADEQANLDIGLDVATWISEGDVDMVVGSERANLIDTGMSDRWLPDIANRVGVPAYYRPPRRIYDHRVGKPDAEMFRALSQTLRYHGWAGIFDGYYPWPFGEREYKILREIGHPMSTNAATSATCSPPAKARPARKRPHPTANSPWTSLKERPSLSTYWSPTTWKAPKPKASSASPSSTFASPSSAWRTISRYASTSASCPWKRPRSPTSAPSAWQPSWPEAWTFRPPSPCPPTSSHSSSNSMTSSRATTSWK